MDTKQLQEIRERAEKATPGPWAIGPSIELTAKWAIISRDGIADGDDPWFIATLAESTPGGPDDGIFIAHARADIPALLAEVERLQVELNARDAVLRAVGIDPRRINT